MLNTWKGNSSLREFFLEIWQKLMKKKYYYLNYESRFYGYIIWDICDQTNEEYSWIRAHLRRFHRILTYLPCKIKLIRKSVFLFYESWDGTLTIWNSINTFNYWTTNKSPYNTKIYRYEKLSTSKFLRSYEIK